jgi:S-DNA-T family DNA segregation ATPase FtsK/SpoIIIE
LRIGYPRAARLVEELEEMGIVGPAQGGGKEREVLIDIDDDGDVLPDE